MTLGNLLAQTGITSKQITSRYAEYSPTTHEQTLYYPYYETAPPTHVHVSNSKYHYHGGGSHKSNAAMSALTLLAFLFFLHILQQCLRDHMNSMSTPQVMIVSSGKEGEEKIDKSGIAETNNNLDESEPGNQKELHRLGNERVAAIVSSITHDDRYLTKITPQYDVKNKANRYKNLDQYEYKKSQYTDP